MEFWTKLIAIALAAFAIWNYRAAMRHLSDAEEFGRLKDYYSAGRVESLRELEKLDEIGRRGRAGHNDCDDGHD